ncbi:MAG: ChbG/HpnK family deacetylase [Gemmataceae bacterium]
MRSDRLLVVVADDFGIGPETSRGILELGQQGRVTATVLLVNSPHTESAVAAWQRAGRPIELGWHPCLTLDAPLLPATDVPSLVDGEGNFWRLGAFLRRIMTGRIRAREVAAEFTAQYQRFVELVGRPPTVINSHQHVALFPPVGSALLHVLDPQQPRPFFRNNRESSTTLTQVPGARLKRSVLSTLGHRLGRRTARLGYAGCDVFLGVTDPANVADERFLVRWLSTAIGATMELMCHPGHDDETLVGRDCCRNDDCVSRRVREYHLLRLASFPEVCRRVGVRLVAPSELVRGRHRQAA